MRIPSKQQLEAIKHYKGPAEVIAGPGSGKTYTIIQRILYLIRERKIQPEQILVITFSKAAVQEMKERFQKENASSAVHFCTFHSLGYQILRSYQGMKTDALLGEPDKKRVIKQIMCNLGLEEEYDDYTAEKILDIISYQKNKGYSSNTNSRILQKEQIEGKLPDILHYYEEYMQEQGKIDFDDMILKCNHMLAANEAVRQELCHQFVYLFVDEFQDINRQQYEMLRYLAYPENNIFAVGDDDQAIYGFRGATPDVMQSFLCDYADSKQIFLTENYRSGKPIVMLAANVIQKNTKRFDKLFLPVKKTGNIQFFHMDSRKEEEKRIIQLLRNGTEHEQEQSAVILRTNMEAKMYAAVFLEQGIPVRRIRRIPDIFSSFIMEDILAFLRFVYEGNHRSDFLRFMNKPNRYLARSALPESIVYQEQLELYYQHNKRLKAQIHTLFSMCRLCREMLPYLAVTMFRKTLQYDQYLREIAKENKQHQEYLKMADHIQNCLYQVRGCRNFGAFFEEAGKKNREKAYAIEEKGVAVITMHAAKGLEFDTVYLPDVNDGVIPSTKCRLPEDYEEERRLLYVAITRARENLYLFETKERNRKISRYLQHLSFPQNHQ